MKRFLLLCVMGFWMCLLVVPIGAIQVPESVDEYYWDDAHIMSEELEYYLSEKNYYMDRYCGAYIEVVTQEYINCDILDYSVALFREWQIGSSQDNGILFMIVSQEEKYYVTIGRGLESKISSATIDEILQTYFEPYFDQGDYETGIRKTFDALYGELVHIYGYPSTNDDYLVEDSLENIIWSSIMAFLVMLIIIMIIVVIWLSLKSRRVSHSPRRYPSRTYTHTYRQPTHRTTTYHRPTHHSSHSSSRTSTSHRSHASASRSRGGHTRGSGGGRR